MTVLLLCLIGSVSAVGVFRTATGNWYMDTTKTGVVAASFHFGTTGDVPVIGDWNGDGITNVGVFRPSNGNWYLDTTKTGVVNKTFHFGTTGDSPKVIQPSTIATIAPIAAFISDKQTGAAPLTVTFIDHSTGTAPLAYAWDFNNDGTTDSSSQNPSFTYTSAGIYTVKLTVTNGAGSNTTLKTGYITANPAGIAPTAAFTSNKQSGAAPLTVTFTDQSSGTAPLAYAWDFNNDGTTDSTSQNPSFTYTSAGIYAVKLTVTNAAGSNTQRETDYISVNEVPQAPSAVFNANIRSGNAPLTVRFTDQSTGSSPKIYAWDFNDDGVVDSTDSSPIFTYSTIGNYTVKLTVTNEVGSDTTKKSDYISVAEDQPGGSPEGIALTFDDNSIDQWYAIRGLLKQYHAHATFFVTQYENLDQNEVNELKALQADGNEIGYHGYAHLDATTYLENHTVNDYMNNEIINGVTLMRADGFNPVDFALPGGAGDENAGLITALSQYFTHIRGIDRAPPYYQYGSNVPLIHAQGIDDISYGQTMNDLYHYISTAKDNDEIVIFYGHIPVQTVTGDYQVSYDRLNNILKNVSDSNMKFYTVSEIN